MTEQKSQSTQPNDSQKRVEKKSSADQPTLSSEQTQQLQMRNDEMGRAVESLQKSKSFFETLSTVAPVGIFRTDREGNCVYVNDRGLTIAGMKPEDAMGKGWTQAIHPGDRERVLKSWCATVLKHRPFNMEYRLQSSDGHTTWVLGQAKAEQDKEGQVVSYVGTITDITIIKQAEENLAKREEICCKTFKQAAVGVAHVSPEGRFIRINQRFCDIVGYTREEMLALTFQDITHPDDLETDLEYVRQTLAGKIHTYSMDKRYIRKDGSLVWVYLAVSLVSKVSGEPDYFISVVEDITERKRFEASKERLALAIDSAELAIWDWNIKTGGVIFNERWARMRGYRMEEIQPHISEWEKGIHADDLPTLRPILTDHLEGRTQVFQAEYRVLTKSGQLIWILDRGAVVDRDADGNPLRMVGIVIDFTNRKHFEEQIYNLAFYDTLTQLPNSRLLKDRIKQAMAASRRHVLYSALMFLDLDNFKQLNDTHGHATGDLLLAEAARRITSCVREVDTVSRFGGDEFVVLLSELNIDKAESIREATVVAEKISNILAKPYVLTFQPENEATVITIEHHCTASIGVVLFISHESSVEDIIKWADMAMYEAKKCGRNLIRFLAR